MTNKYLVTCDWLAQNLNNPQVLVVDCRFQLSDPAWGYTQYCQSHIPGAYYLDLDKDLSAPVQTHGGRHPLPNSEEFADKLASIGVVKGKTTIVAYDSSRFAFAARLWWLVRYLGHSQVVLLDGGWDAWCKGQYPVTKTIPQPSFGTFEPTTQAGWLVDIEAVKASLNLNAVVLVDSRDRDRYQGLREPIDPIAGHIPGAVNSPWQQVTNEDGYLRPLTDQQKLWADYQPAEDIIVYCGSGVTACVNLFSLELAGIDRAKLYPGGWSDWCSYLNL